jgi:hypothetical protein
MPLPTYDFVLPFDEREFKRGLKSLPPWSILFVHRGAGRTVYTLAAKESEYMRPDEILPERVRYVARIRFPRGVPEEACVSRVWNLLKAGVGTIIRDPRSTVREHLPRDQWRKAMREEILNSHPNRAEWLAEKGLVLDMRI